MKPYWRTCFENLLSKEAYLGAKVLYLDDSEDLRVLMDHLVKRKFGEPCLCVRDVGDLIEHGEQALNCEVAILDINLGLNTPTGLDAFSWLQEQHFAGKIFFLTGHAQSHPLVSKACSSGATVWSKPIPTQLVFSKIDEILNTRQDH